LKYARAGERERQARVVAARASICTGMRHGVPWAIRRHAAGDRLARPHRCAGTWRRCVSLPCLGRRRRREQPYCALCAPTNGRCLSWTLGAPLRRARRPCPRTVNGGPARLRERIFLSWPHQARSASSGAGGGSCCANSGAARRAGVQGRPAQRGRGARAGAVRQAVSTGLLRRRPRDEALDAEHRSAVARRPQAAADRGRMSATGTSTRPATRGLRAPPLRPRFADREALSAAGKPRDRAVRRRKSAPPKSRNQDSVTRSISSAGSNPNTCP